MPSESVAGGIPSSSSLLAYNPQVFPHRLKGVYHCRYHRSSTYTDLWCLDCEHSHLWLPTKLTPKIYHRTSVTCVFLLMKSLHVPLAPYPPRCVTSLRTSFSRSVLTSPFVSTRAVDSSCMYVLHVRVPHVAIQCHCTCN